MKPSLAAISAITLSVTTAAHAESQRPVPRPESLSYSEGDEVPPGYVLREEPLLDVIIAGSAIFTVGYGAGVAGAAYASFENSSGFLLVPVAGPWLTLATRNWCAGGGDDVGDTGCGYVNGAVAVAFVIDGLVQAGGAATAIAGSVVKKRFLVRRDPFTVVPLDMGPGAHGIGVFGRF